MCGRLNQKGENYDSWKDYRGYITLEIPRLNVAPTEDVALVRDGQIELARWWLTPAWSDGPSQKYSMFNAKCETLAKSPAFRGPFKSQRGIVPMASFIEWQGSGKSKQPWSITNEEESLCAAALWDVWHGTDGPLLSCTIVTTAAAEPFKEWHSRMPVLLDENERARWLDNSVKIPQDDPAFRSELKLPWLVSPLDKAVGNSRNKSPELMESIGETVVLAA
jgi:putative SOS response-associated peptidase YedK